MTIAGMVAAPGPAVASAEPDCRDIDIPVTVAGAAHTVYGRLCNPAGGPSAALQVLVHGATYDHFYWDLPGFDGRYSYVRRASEAGYSTLAIDRIGSGRSSRPPATEVTALSNAEVLHQVVRAMRRGEVSDPWKYVVTVGHSFGTVVTDVEAATYRDVDAVIATGWLSRPGLLTSMDLITRQQAGTDGALPAGYFTMRPNGREMFMAAGHYEPQVLTAVEALGGTITLGETATPMTAPLVQAGNPIAVPTLLVLGEYDPFFCTPPEHQPCTAAGVLTSERPFFTDAAQPAVHVQPGAGHSIAHETNAQDGFDAMLAWMRNRAFVR
ncbi:alpha/beta hydrolase [Nocardia inohanensis]|uniref:alpha/beta hydrolase n=1 Tax=Nocardia inohanensis TaxID=209246 RepID=UPI001C3F67C9|nr:alpha/beta fold hydrolase [Nocardia inohanensis]